MEPSRAGLSSPNSVVSSTFTRWPPMTTKSVPLSSTRPSMPCSSSISPAVPVRSSKLPFTVTTMPFSAVAPARTSPRVRTVAPCVETWRPFTVIVPGPLAVTAPRIVRARWPEPEEPSELLPPQAARARAPTRRNTDFEVEAVMGPFLRGA
jgi:hypothetical protein